MKINMHDALKMLGALVRGFEIIDSLHGSNPTTIKGVVQAIRDGLDGKTSPELVEAELRSIQDLITEHDTTIKDRLDKKFPFDTTDEENPE